MKDENLLMAPEQDVVLLSRVRLSRNYADIPFSPKLEGEQAQRNIERVDAAMNKMPEAGAYTLYRMKEQSPQQLRQLLEQHLISRSLIKRAEQSAALISTGYTVSVMINGEDHLRIQGLLPGLQLERSAELAFRVDDHLSTQGEFAFDPRWGYLTAGPTNAGTGLRAAVLLHLHALQAAGKAAQVGQEIARIGMSLRGLRGDGNRALGALYLLSNQATLGRTEEDIIRSLIAAAMQITGHERAMRTQMAAADKNAVADKLLRSLGILRYARIMEEKEFLGRMSDLRLAACLGMADIGVPKVDALMRELQQGALGAATGETDEARLNLLRADRLRSVLV